jgi:hypothetical protein
MAHPLGNIDNQLTQVAKEMTEAQIEITLELVEKYKLGPESFHAALTCLATNLQSLILRPR